MLLLFAAALPLLLWDQGVNTAPDLRKAGFSHIAVPAPEAAQWGAIEGISVDPVDIALTVKLQAPGVALQTDEASASRVPWVSSNGWRFLRQPHAKFRYDVPGKTAPLAAAEAFCYGSNALIRTDSDGIAALAKMLQFLQSIDSQAATSIADIQFGDDDSAISAEVMNLMVRDNLLFRVGPALGNSKLRVQLGTRAYPASSVKDADAIVHKIRANLTDERRSVRLFGTSVVIVRLTSEPGKCRVHLLNYGAGSHLRVGGFRVRVLGRYPNHQIHSFDTPDEQLLDYEVQSGATEFTVPDLKSYAVIDLSGQI